MWMSVDQSWTTAPSFFTMTAKYHDLQGFILERARNPSTPPKMVADREKNHNSCLIPQDSTDLGLRVCWVDQPLWTKGWPPFSRFWPRAERRRRSARENLVSVVPSGKLWKITIFNGKIHYKWPFSIAMLVYQRVTGKMMEKSSSSQE